MSKPVAFRVVARNEAEDAARWYEEQRAGLGVDFLAELQQVLDAIGEQLDRYPVALGDTREAPLARFPYCVYYRDRAGAVVVTAVFHTARDPTIWQGRA